MTDKTPTVSVATPNYNHDHLEPVNSKGKHDGKLRFAALDSWRGVCACFVALCHAPIYSHFYYAPLVRNAVFFVDFFFVLSGFVLSHAYSHKLQSGRDAVDFIIRRFGRLWPLHAATLFVLVFFDLIRIAVKVALGHATNMFALAQEPVLGTLSIISQIFLVSNMGPQLVFAGKFDWNYPSWSISIEFYVCVAFALISVAAGRKKNWLLSGLCALAAAWTLNSYYAAAINAAWSPFSRGMYGFFMGHFAYWFYKRINLSTPAPTVLESATLAAVLLFISTAQINNRFLFGAPIIFGFAVFVFAQEGGFVSKLFKIAIARKLGDWSYSIYLVHVLVLQAFGVFVRRAAIHVVMIKLPELPAPTPVDVFASPWYGDAALCIYLIVVIGIASLTYRYIEKPSRKFFYKFADARRPQAGG